MAQRAHLGLEGNRAGFSPKIAAKLVYWMGLELGGAHKHLNSTGWLWGNNLRGNPGFL